MQLLLPILLVHLNSVLYQLFHFFISFCLHCMDSHVSGSGFCHCLNLVFFLFVLSPFVVVSHVTKSIFIYRQKQKVLFHSFSDIHHSTDFNFMLSISWVSKIVQFGNVDMGVCCGIKSVERGLWDPGNPSLGVGSIFQARHLFFDESLFYINLASY